ncbi:PREDICTED: uncharacterized protein LOC106810162 [Priapulus caudatus]|uniref:Uncharacterized protein LOC106810162 n=1 Tax=Priapulus caudatus TaxID=37621 RepID=A0ABM1E9R0_PRICU|nr:PREDICTED: uncharacterized protein LOC106810162 [Priapulus caudatus]
MSQGTYPSQLYAAMLLALFECVEETATLWAAGGFAPSPVVGARSFYGTSSTDQQSKVYFDPLTPRNITGEVDKTVYLQCRVHNIGDKHVSWIRKRDLAILSISNVTYTNDERFKLIHESGSLDWTLQLKYPRQEDSGLYECQVSTHPKLTLLISLDIYGA